MKTNGLSLLLIPMFIGFAPLPPAQGVSPAPDGGYPGGNTAEGQNALLSLTSGTYNTAVGVFSLTSTLIGSLNTAVGAGTLLSNVSEQNTAIGAGALLSNTSGDANTAAGAFALFNNTIGDANTALGGNALLNNAQGNYNTAIGISALYNHSTGDLNTAVGEGALFNCTTGEDNTGIGAAALFKTTGTHNTALGSAAGSNITTAHNVICIGAYGANVSDSCFIDNIRDVTTQNGDAMPVVIDSAGQLGTASSSKRFKKEVKPMDHASEAILALNPVTFHYKSDRTNTSQFGLIAEEVANVNPDLVVRDKNGDIYTVRYDAVNAMLLNEFLKEHRRNQEQQQQINVLTAQLKEQAAQIQKVNAQLEASKPAPQTVLNSQ